MVGFVPPSLPYVPLLPPANGGVNPCAPPPPDPPKGSDDGLPVLKLVAFVPPPPPPFTVVVSNVVVPPSPPRAPVPFAPTPPALIVTVLLPGVID